MIGELIAYYRRNSISAMDFNCRDKEKCKGNNQRFSTAKEPYIGEEYEKGNVPRLLFISLDSGESDSEDVTKKTLKGVKEAALAWRPSRKDSISHWYRTHEFAWHIFHELNKLGATKNMGWIKDTFHLENLDKIKPYFAHTNSAKCCQNKPHNEQADAALFRNCLNNVLGEIDILDPDIIVTQGYFARKVLEKYMRSSQADIIEQVNISGAGTEPDYTTFKTNDGKQVIWVHHYHPRNFGKFHKNFKKYQEYTEKIAQRVFRVIPAGH
jgi:hypothetical protein